MTDLPAAIQGWRRSRGAIVTLLGVTQIFAWGSSYYLPAVLAAPTAHATGWSLAWVVGGLSLGLAVAGSISPLVGSRIGRGYGREILAASAFLLGIGLLCIGLAPTLTFYLAGWVLIGLGMGAGLYDAAFATLGTLYGLEARRTITLLTLFGGFASTVCWPLSAFFLEQFGWRGACIAYAAIQLGLSLPAYFFVLPAPIREPAGIAPTHAANDHQIVPPGQLASFLALGASISLAALISTTLSVHLLTILQSRGASLTAAVALGAMVGPAQVTARVVEMLLGKHYHPIWTKLAATSLVTTGIFLFWNGAPFLAVGLIAYGCGIGLKSIARGALPLALYGAPGYGARMGRLAMPSLAAQAMAPYLGALLMQYAGVSATLGVLTALASANVGLVVALRMAAVRIAAS